MLLLESLVYAILVIGTCLTVRHFIYKGDPVPPQFMIVYNVFVTLLHIILGDVTERQWTHTVVNVLFSYLGFWLFLFVVEDTAYYRNLYQDRRRSTKMAQTAPEDHPNWSNYRP